MRFLVFAPNDWEEQWMNRQQLFSRIGRKNTVTYSTGLFFSWDTKTQRYLKAPNFFNVLKHRDNVDILSVSKIFCRVPKLRYLDVLIVKLFGLYINKLMGNEKVCLYLFHPKFYQQTSSVKKQLLVYHLYDDLSLQRGYELYREDDEVLLKEADIVICSSKLLQQKIIEKTGRKDILFLPNGVDSTAFSTPRQVPSELKDIRGPKVTYTGSINEKVDLELLLSLSLELENVNFILVGNLKENVLPEKLITEIKRRPNIFLLGFKEKTEMIGYVQHSDVNIMIYKTDGSTWSKYIYPLKMHEYLSTGKPIISSDIDAVREYSAHIHIASDKESWIQAIQTALSEPTFDENKVKIAKLNDWEHRVDSLYHYLKLD